MILAVMAILLVSGASLTAEHSHLKTPNEHCDICCTAHMASQQAVVLHVVLALNALNFAPPPEAFASVESRISLAFLTRGPPAPSLAL